jgi:hypothetical protein
MKAAASLAISSNVPGVAPPEPIVQRRRQMVKQHDGNAALAADFPEYEFRAVYIDGLGRCGLRGCAHRFLSIGRETG